MLSRVVAVVTLSSVLSVFLPTTLVADKHIVEEVTIRSPASSSGGAGTERKADVETWFSATRFARIDNLGNISHIVRRDLGKMYIVLHSEELVVEIDLPFTLHEQLRPLFNEVRMEWKTEKSNELQTAYNLVCRKAKASGNGTISVLIEMWLSPETGVDARSFNSFLGEALKPYPLFRGLAPELAGLGTSISLRTIITTTRMGLSTVRESEVKSITDEPARIQLYDPPDDYRKEPLNFKTYLALVRSQNIP